VKHPFRTGEPVSRQLGDAVKRTARALKWIGWPVAEIGTPDASLTSNEGERQDMERRLNVGRARWGRRRSDGLASAEETPRVLLIEPHPETRLLYACLFEDAGYAVYAVADGIGAIDVARGRLPDVVVMDLAAPGSAGFDIIRQFREDPLTATIPIVVVTSRLRFDVPVRARASGAVSVFAQPTGPETLLAEVTS
jgi:CheY-like chemotaxis protein